MDKNVKYSVVIPTYNRPQMLFRAVDSVLKQGLTNLEIIVVNDGSSVSYDKFRNEFSEQTLTYIEAPISSGASAARNTGINAAKGEWIILLDDDDHFNDGYFELLNKEIDSNTDIDFFWCGVKIVDPRKEASTPEKLIEFNERYQSTQEIYLKAITIGSGYGVVIRKRIFDRFGAFDTDFKVAEDTDLILNFAANEVRMKPIAYVGVTIYADHEERLSCRYKAHSELNVLEKLFQKYENFFNLSKNTSIYQSLLYWCAKIHLGSGRSEDMIYALCKLKETIPVQKRCPATKQLEEEFGLYPGQLNG